MNSSETRPTRKRPPAGQEVTERKIQEILHVTAGSIRKMVNAGFGQTFLSVSVRHGSICEAKVEDKETTTIAL